jgi:hypothetical protein
LALAIATTAVAGPTPMTSPAVNRRAPSIAAPLTVVP